MIKFPNDNIKVNNFLNLSFKINSCIMYWIQIILNNRGYC